MKQRGAQAAEKQQIGKRNEDSEKEFKARQIQNSAVSVFQKLVLHIYSKKNLQKNEKNNVVGDMRKLAIGITGVRGLRKMS